jgi:hypothetical protein
MWVAWLVDEMDTMMAAQRADQSAALKAGQSAVLKAGSSADHSAAL